MTYFFHTVLAIFKLSKYRPQGKTKEREKKKEEKKREKDTDKGNKPVVFEKERGRGWVALSESGERVTERAECCAFSSVEIWAWMNNNFLQLNSSKTEAILIGSPHQIRTSTINCITFSGQHIPLSPVVTNLGVRFDPHLTFEAHIKRLCKTSFHHLRNIARLRPTLTLRDAEKLVHAFVSSRLDYCNALLIGIPNKSIQKLQHVQNCAARILMRVRKYEHITPILQSLHWLPISARIEYKVSLLTHQCIHGDAPMYLKELLIPQTSVRSLCSTSTHRLLPLLYSCPSLMECPP
ncbi:Protein angel [Labeo rohita]|uniref:Protein angel n=1 Tax=Labeo rohita TaxID=84645 RepID=A0ABQ8M4M7_LABRO|nr:Protein angel [Labeo rohita]